MKPNNGAPTGSTVEVPAIPAVPPVEAPAKNGKGAKSAQPVEQKVAIPKPDKRVVEIELVGKTPLILHKFSEKARKQMQMKQGGAARMKKEPKVPEQEYEAAIYYFADDHDRYGIPAVSFKKAMVNACRHVEGLPMTVARGAFHVYGHGKGEDGRDLVEILTDAKPRMRQDVVRLESGVADLRYRPEFINWRVKLKIEFLATSVSAEEVANLLNVAGFAVGVGENRPEKSGDTNGQFTLAAETDAAPVAA